jgi:hypothetical protein
MTKHALSAPLLIGIVGAVDDSVRPLLRDLDRLLQATPIFLLTAGEGNAITTETLAAGPGEPRADGRNPKVFLTGVTGDPSVDQQRAAYLLKNCTFVVVPASHADSSLAQATAAYQRALPFWTPPTGEQQTFGREEDAFCLPYPAPVLDSEWLATLVRMAREACAAWHKPAEQGAASWRRLFRKFFGQELPRLTDEEYARIPGSRERSAFRSLPGQLRQLDAFNTELGCLKTARWFRPVQEPSPSEWMRVIREATDRCAQEHQNAWQNLVYSTTKRLADAHTRMEPADPESSTSQEILDEIKDHAEPPLLLSEDESPSDVPAIWKSLAVLGVVAATLFAAFTELSGGFANETWQRYGGLSMMSVYTLILAYAFMRYRNAKAMEHERKHQDYRLIAECLRVQQAWASCGMRHYVADALPPEQVSESSWVSNAVRAIRWRHPHNAATWSTAAGVVAKSRFVADQLDYYNRKLVRRRETALQLLARRARFALGWFLFGLAGLLFNSAVEASIEHGMPPLLHHLWIIMTVFAVSLWAANKKVAETFGFEAEILRGNAVRNALALAHASLSVSLSAVPDDAIQHQGMTPHARQTLLGIGRVFVEDQAGWHALHRSRPIDVVTGT